MKVVTGVPDVWSTAPGSPTPCGYTAFRSVQLAKCTADGGGGGGGGGANGTGGGTGAGGGAGEAGGGARGTGFGATGAGGGATGAGGGAGEAGGGATGAGSGAAGAGGAAAGGGAVVVDDELDEVTTVALGDTEDRAAEVADAEADADTRDAVGAEDFPLFAVPTTMKRRTRAPSPVRILCRRNQLRFDGSGASWGGVCVSA